MFPVKMLLLPWHYLGDSELPALITHGYPMTCYKKNAQSSEQMQDSPAGLHTRAKESLAAMRLSQLQALLLHLIPLQCSLSVQ